MTEKIDILNESVVVIDNKIRLLKPVASNTSPNQDAFSNANAEDHRPPFEREDDQRPVMGQLNANQAPGNGNQGGNGANNRRIDEVCIILFILSSMFCFCCLASILVLLIILIKNYK